MMLKQPNKASKHHKKTNKANEIYAEPSKRKHGQGFIGVINHLPSFRNVVNLTILVPHIPSNPLDIA